MSDLEYVQPTKTRKGYWRRIRFDKNLPSLHQRRTRALLARITFEEEGNFGKAEVVGKDGNIKELPKNTKAVQDNMKGIKVAPEQL